MNESALVRARTDLDNRLTAVAEKNIDSLETIRQELQSLHGRATMTGGSSECQP